MKRVGVDPGPLAATADRWRLNGSGVIFVAVGFVLADLPVVADPVRSSAHDAIVALREAGLRIVMLTGDNPITAKAVASAVGGLDEVRAGLLPEDKARVIAEFLFNGIGVPVAAGVLYPVTGILLSRCSREQRWRSRRWRSCSTRSVLPPRSSEKSTQLCAIIQDTAYIFLRNIETRQLYLLTYVAVITITWASS